jgi:hypothetical protein
MDLELRKSPEASTRQLQLNKVSELALRHACGSFFDICSTAERKIACALRAFKYRLRPWNVVPIDLLHQEYFGISCGDCSKGERYLQQSGATV